MRAWSLPESMASSVSSISGLMVFASFDFCWLFAFASNIFNGGFGLGVIVVLGLGWG